METNTIQRDFNSEIPKHYAAMYERAYNHTGNADGAKELVQTAILKAMEYNMRKGWNPTGGGKNYDRDLSAYLCMIVQTSFITKTRRDKVRKVLPLMDTLDPCTDDVFREVSNRDMRGHIKQTLTEGELYALESKVLYQDSQQTIADAMNIDAESAKHLIWAAETKLRLRFKKRKAA